ncbi:hypothetical protein F4780DRAFT_545398 [Xylariomycetidae sp. FL0641]|nr:hypothetical protein F4780DRAFT_545398 [Xylariomycetidae sp. FL0641]
MEDFPSVLSVSQVYSEKHLEEQAAAGSCIYANCLARAILQDTVSWRCELRLSSISWPGQPGGGTLSRCRGCILYLTLIAWKWDCRSIVNMMWMDGGTPIGSSLPRLCSGTIHGVADSRALGRQGASKVNVRRSMSMVLYQSTLGNKPNPTCVVHDAPIVATYVQALVYLGYVGPGHTEGTEKEIPTCEKLASLSRVATGRGRWELLSTVGDDRIQGPTPQAPDCNCDFDSRGSCWRYLVRCDVRCDGAVWKTAQPGSTRPTICNCANFRSSVPSICANGRP